MKTSLKANRVGGAIGALLSALLGFALAGFNLPAGKKLVHLSYDLPFLLRPAQTPDEVRMVYLNDEAHRELNQPFNAPWDREIYARLVEKLTAEQSRAVVFDIVFSDPSANPAADQHFARALRANGRVILAADYVPAGFGLAEGRTTTLPIDALRNAAAGWGISQLIAHPDFLVRRHYHGPLDADPPTFSESWTAAALCGAPPTRDPAARTRERWVNYYGPPATLPAAGIHQAIAPDGVPPGFFSNKVVFVGSYLSTFLPGVRKDEFKNPYTGAATESSRAAFMPGAEVHATIFLNLLRNDWLTRSTAPAELLGALLLGLVFGYGLVQFRPSVTFVITLAAVALLTATACVTFARFRWWFPWLIGVTQIAAAFSWAIVFNSIQLYVQKKLLEQTLSLYLSPKLVKRFSGDRQSQRKFLQPGAEKQALTILFSDIAGFTSLSEGMDSDQLARSMNQYFQNAVAGCIHPTDGTVVKYIGDAIFAFWNAPEAQPDHELRACRAALRFQKQEAQYLNGQPLITRIGLHTGVANVGNFGSTERVDYTALGENINLASRMEGLNKYLGTVVLATGDTYRAVADQIISRCAGHFRLKGFEKAVEVHELIGFKEDAESSRPWREAFAEGLKHFRQQSFDAAETGFQRAMELHLGDGPARFYLERIAELLRHPPPDNWSGEIDLKEK